MIKVGIIGGAGYTAGELLRILMFHPEVEITYVHSSSNAGNPLYAVHTDLVGETEMRFTDTTTDNIDVMFLCMGHGASRKYLTENEVAEHIKIIDLSHDYRLKATASDFVYGLPELQRDAVRSAKNIANPGCFATCIQMALLPLAANGLLTTDVHVSAITGSTGAGQKPTSTTHFSWRNNNVSVYKAFEHQHLGEIGQSVRQLQNSFAANINFIPLRGNFSRGILASVYTDCALPANDLQKIYADYYAEHPFTHVVAAQPDVKMVVNTNKCVLSVEKHGDKVLIISVIDNLLKGASGQAVQNMNLMFGLDERTGLDLKAIGF